MFVFNFKLVIFVICSVFNSVIIFKCFFNELSIGIFVGSINLDAKQFSICNDQFHISESQKAKEEKSLESILKNQPENIECMLKLASVYLRTDKVSQAFDLITQAYTSNPKFVKNAKISKILDLALRLSRLKIRANEERSYTLWNELGEIYFEMGIFRESANAYEHSLKLNDAQKNMKILLAICYGHFYEYESSKRVFAEVLSKDSYSFYANYYYSKLLKNVLREKGWKPYMLLSKFIIENQNPKFKSEDEKDFFVGDIEHELAN